MAHGFEHPSQNADRHFSDSTPSRKDSEDSPELSAEAAARPETTGAPDAVGGLSENTDFRSVVGIVNDPRSAGKPSAEVINASKPEDASDPGDDRSSSEEQGEPRTDAPAATNSAGDGRGDGPPPPDTPPPPTPEDGDERRAAFIRSNCRLDALNTIHEEGRDSANLMPNAGDNHRINGALVSLAQADGSRGREYAADLREPDEPTLAAMRFAQMDAGGTQAVEARALLVDELRHDEAQFRREQEELRQEELTSPIPLPPADRIIPPMLATVVEECEARIMPTGDIRGFMEDAGYDAKVQQTALIGHYQRVIHKPAYPDTIQQEADEFVSQVAADQETAADYLRITPALLDATNNPALQAHLVSECVDKTTPFSTETAALLPDVANRALTKQTIPQEALDKMDEAMERAYARWSLRETTLPPDFIHADKTWQLGYMVRSGKPIEEVHEVYEVILELNPRIDAEALAASTIKTCMDYDNMGGARYLLNKISQPRMREAVLYKSWAHARTAEQVKRLPPENPQLAADHGRAYLARSKDPDELAPAIETTLDFAEFSPPLAEDVALMGTMVLHLAEADITRAEGVARYVVAEAINAGSPFNRIHHLLPFYKVLSQRDKPENLIAAWNSLQDAKGSPAEKIEALATLVHPPRITA